MNLKSQMLILSLAMFAMLSCKKSNDVEPVIDPPVVTPPVIVPPVLVDIYAVGYTRAANGFDVTTYWKNGIPVKLTDSTTNCFGVDIAVSGTDVYVLGHIGATNGIPDQAVWKNGVMTRIGGNSNRIFIQRQDFFTTSHNGDYGKNGVVAPKLSAGEITAKRVAVVGNDVYIVGSYRGSTSMQPRIACYWKNGVRTKLGTDTTSVWSEAHGIAVSGNDVYIAGSNPVGKGVYWKNGIPTFLNAPLAATEATAIAVVGNDVYSGGFVSKAGTNYIPSYWKNGVVTELSPATPYRSYPAVETRVDDIKVYGSDVYTIGREDGVLTCWKNKTAIRFNDIAGNRYYFRVTVAAK